MATPVALNRSVRVPVDDSVFELFAHETKRAIGAGFDKGLASF